MLPTTIKTPAAASARRKSSVTEDAGDSCRICRGEGTLEQPLFFPCKCSGSIKYVHQDCLMEWLSHSHKKYCELCKTPFRFTKLYDQSMPDTVPIALFVHQALLHAVKAVGSWIRYALVFFVWLCWLPWMIRQIWRWLFWIADGSWMTSHRLYDPLTLRIDAEAGPQQLNATAEAIKNSTVVERTYTLVDLLISLPSLLHPARVVRGIVKAMWRPAVSNDTVASVPRGNWSVSFHFTSSHRPPSVLSEFQALNSFTRHDTFNYALLDVVEGQLICLFVIAAFILVFLIREWVINHQPLNNPADVEQNDVQQQLRQDENPIARQRRRRRPARPLPDHNAQLQNHDDQPQARVLAQPRMRRAATENNILVQDAENHPRPQAPQRAASLIVPTSGIDLEIAGLPEAIASDIVTEDIEAPPLSRGTFDEVAQIHRTLEERNNPSVHEPNEMTTNTLPTTETAPPSSPHVTDESNMTPQANFTFGSPSMHPPHETPDTTNEFTFRAPPSTSNFANSDTAHAESLQDSRKLSPENSSESPSDSSIVETPTSSASVGSMENDHAAEPGLNVVEDPSVTSPIIEPETPDVEVNGVLDKIARWLWHTEHYVPGADVAEPEADEAEVVQDIAAAAPFVPVRHAPEAVNNAQQQPANDNPVPPNIQDGVDLNDPNAIDDAEDLEGILELIGIEGPIGAMFQNVCFSIFLITLTLSASVWCPYIWGKITLLFIANPFGVFVRAPLYLVSQTADIIVDSGLYVIGLTGLGLNYVIRLTKTLINPLIPVLGRYLDTTFLEDATISLSHNSSQRLRRAVSGAFLNLRPDLPTFSMQSHHALRVFSGAIVEIGSACVAQTSQALLEVRQSLDPRTIYRLPIIIGTKLHHFPASSRNTLIMMRTWFTRLVHELKPLSFQKPEDIDYTLIEWTAKEKAVCVILGYCFFASAGVAYLKIMHWIAGLRKDEKVEGVFADTLRQAGGVLKVIGIIGIEMIVFPLYCGFILDLALLPLFEGATAHSRFQFLYNSPVTALFVHWFLGTCYMFHFALFVSMCRKILRKGVLYFIRDPDDPSFHPVRDVLERPVLNQLGKIAFSACVYGSLLIVCLGGVITGLNCVGGILPIHWTTHEPIMAFPADIVFYNLMLPFILRKIELSKKIAKLYEWWFRGCAAGLRLTNFLFGIRKPEEQEPNGLRWRAFGDRLLGRESMLASLMLAVQETPAGDNKTVSVRVLDGQESDREHLLQLVNDKLAPAKIEKAADGLSATLHFDSAEQVQLLKESWNATAKVEVDISKTDLKTALEHIQSRPQITDGSYVRAPAKDSVRIPKGTNVFLHVNNLNERIDGHEDLDTGMHGRKDDRFQVIYVPSHFKARISAFIILVWTFAAFTGLVFLVGPLLLGRLVIQLLCGSTGPPNDLYAFTLGVHICGLLAYISHATITKWQSALHATGSLLRNTRNALPQIVATIKHILGLVYLAIAFGLILPLGLSILCELYIHIPLYTILGSTPGMSSISAKTNQAVIPAIEHRDAHESHTPLIHLFQTWAIGLFYMRLVIRVLTNYPNRNTRAATAIRSIIRHGILHPDVRLATRAVVFPVITLNIILLAVPIALANCAISSPVQLDRRFGTESIYRFSFPAVLLIGLTIFSVIKLKSRIRAWRIKIRDEVYLIGERLHNFHEDRPLSTSPKINREDKERDVSKISTQSREEVLESKAVAASTIETDIQEFKDVTGLEDLPSFGDAVDSHNQETYQATTDSNATGTSMQHIN